VSSEISLALVNVLHIDAKLISLYPGILEKIVKNKFVLYCYLHYICTTIKTKNIMSKFHREENKRMVGVLKLQNWTTEQIAQRLGLTKNQVDHISSYYYGKKKQSMTNKKNENVNVFDFEDTYKVPTKENKIVENVKINSPISKTINLNGLEIEIMSNSIKKVIITEDNKIKLL